MQCFKHKIFRRRIITMIFIGLFVFPLFSQDFYYTDKLFNKTFVYTPQEKKICIKFSKNTNLTLMQKMIKNYDLNLQTHGLEKLHYGVFKLSNGTSFDIIISQLSQETSITGIVPVYTDQEGFERYIDPNWFTVQFKEGVSEERIKEILTHRNSKIVIKHWTPGYYTVTIPNDITIFKVVRDFMELTEVKFSEPASYGFNDLLDDTYLENQWHLKNTGQVTGYTQGNDINVFDAWDITYGNTNVVIVITDSGIDQTHPDLRDNILDRGNEDWDFSSTCVEPIDYLGHGTCVSGIAAAVMNDIGVRGVAPFCRIMPLKLNLTSGMNQNRADAINYAVSRKDDFTRMVINCSWRMSSGDFTAVHSAIQNANNNDVPVFVAAGNNNQSPIEYPARYPESIAVAAMTPCGEYRKTPSTGDGENWWGSSYGENLDISAPGVKIYTTDIQGSGGYNYGQSGELTNENYTKLFNGTSSACPMATSLAALLFTINPNLSESELRTIFHDAADKVGGYNYNWNQSKPGHSMDLGFGRIDAYQSTLLSLSYANKSTSGLATYSNNARHLAKEAGYLHEIFSSGGEIFYRRSNNNGSTWQVAKRLSKGNGSNSRPAITTYYDNSIHVVWQRNVGYRTWDIYYTRSSNYGSSWSTSSKIAQNVQTSYYQNSGPQPVIAECFVAAQSMKLMTVYTSSNGLYYATKTSGSGSWPTPTNISGSYNNYIRFPSLAGNIEYFALVYDTRYYGVYSRTYEGSWTSPVKFSDSAPYYERETCVAQEKQGGDMLASWGARPTSSSPFRIYFRRGYCNNTWSNFTAEFWDNVNPGIEYRRPSITYFDANYPNEYAIAILFHSSDNRVIMEKYYEQYGAWVENHVAFNGREANITGYAYDDPKYFWTDQSASPYQVKLSSNFLPKSSTTTKYKNVFARRAVVSNVKDHSAQCLEVSDYLVKTKSGKSYRIAFQSYPDDTVKLDLKTVWNYMDSEPVKLPSDATELVYTKKIYTTLPNDSSGQKFETSFTDASFQLSVVDAKTKSQIAVLDDNAKSAEVHVDISGLAGKEIILYPSLAIAGVDETVLNFGLVNIFYQPNEKVETLQKVTITEKIEPLPTTVRLNPNYPNPFNPLTHIDYSIPENGAVKLNIYDLQGRLVKTIVNSNQEAGNHVVNWDGTNTSGSSVASGVYIYQLRFKNVLKIRKLLLMR